VVKKPLYTWGPTYLRNSRTEGLGGRGAQGKIIGNSLSRRNSLKEPEHIRSGTVGKERTKANFDLRKRPGRIPWKRAEREANTGL